MGAVERWVLYWIAGCLRAGSQLSLVSEGLFQVHVIVAHYKAPGDWVSQVSVVAQDLPA